MSLGNNMSNQNLSLKSPLLRNQRSNKSQLLRKSLNPLLSNKRLNQNQWLRSQRSKQLQPPKSQKKKIMKSYLFQVECVQTHLPSQKLIFQIDGDSNITQ